MNTFAWGVVVGYSISCVRDIWRTYRDARKQVAAARLEAKQRVEAAKLAQAERIAS